MFHIRRMGYNTLHDSNFHVDRPNGYDWYLLLLVKSSATFMIDGKKIITPPNTLIIYDKKHPHLYEAHEGSYRNDWIHFDCSEEETKSILPPLNQPLFITNHYYLSDITQKLTTEFYSTNTHKGTTIHHLMQILLIKVHESLVSPEVGTHNQYAKLYDELIQLRSDIFSNPQIDWTIANMAKQLNISPGYLQAIYKDTFKSTCTAEVIESRVARAKELLAGTDLMIYEVSELCGYKTDVHFMRQFKKQTGFTPSAFRHLID